MLFRSADAAKKALETLSGISTLDAMSASLNNDAHVVHTYTDGTGGDYSSCYTVFSVFLGDTDVSDHIDEIKAVAWPPPQPSPYRRSLSHSRDVFLKECRGQSRRQDKFA